MADTAPMIELRQVRARLVATYTSLIDLADFPHHSPHARELALLHRALAAEAARILTGCGAEEAAAAVVDGVGDQGIDAVITSSSGDDIWFIQAKWSEKAQARVGEADALKLLHGLRQIADRRYEGFNSRIRGLSSRIDEVLSSPGSRVHLVTALAAGDGRLTRQAEERLTQAGEAFGFQGRIPLTVRALGLADFYSAARVAALPASVDLSAHLSDGWHSVDTPYRAYVGSITAGELAAWYESYGPELFDPALRRGHRQPPDRHTVSQLVTSPEEFWYLSQGITVLCDHVTPHYFARRAPGQPVKLTLDNARIINGAQTTRAVARAMKDHPEAADLALVGLRVICLADAPAPTASKITRAVGAEGRTVTLEDLAAQDPYQRHVRNELIHSLNKKYAYQYGEVAPAPSTGCTVQEAALALACAHPTASVIAEAAVGPTGTHDPLAGLYDRLFGQQPRAQQIWQSALLLRQVRKALVEAAADAPSGVRQVIEHGELFIAHLLFQDLGPDLLEMPVPEPPPFAWVVARSRQIAGLLADTVERLYGPHIFLAAIFTDANRCTKLAADLKQSLAEQPAPGPGDRRPRRRPNSVSVLVAHHRLADGTRLMYQPTSVEEREIGEWLRDDPSRYLATWTNDDSRRCLIWAVDGQAYSPSALILRIWAEADWDQAPIAVQGTSRWVVPGEGSLAELAAALEPSWSHDGDA
ncbi:AIPR family protein [Streptomyces sp. NPDC002523]